MTGKARFIEKLTSLSSEEKQKVIGFFTKYPEYEKHIDWNSAALAYADFEKVFAMAESSSRSIKHKAKSDPWLLFENHNCEIIHQADDFLIVAPLDWECAVFFNSFDCGGERAKWSIGNKENDNAWYIRLWHNEICFLVFFVERHRVFGKKILIEYNIKTRQFSVLLQSEPFLTFSRPSGIFSNIRRKRKNHEEPAAKQLPECVSQDSNPSEKMEGGFLLSIYEILRHELSLRSGGRTLWKMCNKKDYILEGSKLRGYTPYVSGTVDLSALNIRAIGCFGFDRCKNLTAIKIPAGVTEIENGAFSGCKRLCAIDVDADNTAYSSIDGVLFDKAGKTLLRYPKGKKESLYAVPAQIEIIGRDAFEGCNNLVYMELPENLTAIKDLAFFYCGSLAGIKIPAGVTGIENGAFSGCKSLCSIGVDAGNSVYSSADGVLFDKTGKTLLQYPAGKKESLYTVPAHAGVIAEGAFSDCANLVHIELSEHLTVIEAWAFTECGSLSGIRIPASVTTIAKDAFSGCKNLCSIDVDAGNRVYSSAGGVLFDKTGKTLVKYPRGKKGSRYTVPAGVAIISEEAFFGCANLVYLELPEHLTAIEDLAFHGCDSLTGIKIPAGVDDIAVYGAFWNIESLCSIDVDVGNTAYSSTGSVLFDKTGKTLLKYPRGKKESRYTVPAQVEVIGKEAFKNCDNLIYIELPEHLAVIEDYAFAFCHNLARVDLPIHLTAIGVDAFARCGSLAGIKIPADVTEIGWGAFFRCTSLRAIDVDKGNTAYSSVDGVLFNKTGKILIQYPEGKKESRYTIPAQVGIIGEAAFGKWDVVEEGSCGGCDNLVYVELPEGLATVMDGVFSCCGNLTGIKIPAGATKIADSMFDDCKELCSIDVDPDNTAYSSADGVLFDKTGKTLIKYPEGKEESRYTVPAGVEVIGKRAFEDCGNLVRVELPEGLTAIGDSAFYGCLSLACMELPEHLVTIGDRAFVYCANLAAIKIPASVTKIGGTIFSEWDSPCSIDVDARNAAYSSTDGVLFDKAGKTLIKYPRGKTASRYTIPAQVEVIGSAAFKDCDNLVHVELPEGLATIGDSAFRDCKNLADMELPEGLAAIGNSAFDNCSSLAHVELPKHLATIGNSAFEGCNNLSSIKISASVTKIDEDVFPDWNSRLCSIDVDADNTAYSSIGGVLFDKTGKTLIKYPAGKKESSYIIPAHVEVIGEWAFRYCDSLFSIKIPAGVTKIEETVFSGFTNLCSIDVDTGNSAYSSTDGVVFDKEGKTLIRYPAGKKESSYIIPAHAGVIGEWAFSDCGNLAAIKIPASITEIAAMAFSSCGDLCSIDVDADNTAYSSIGGVLFDKTGKTLIKYPAGKKESSYTVPAHVEIIGEFAFEDCIHLTRVELPEHLAVIKEGAFFGCTSLPRIKIPSGVVSVGSSAFAECGMLSSIYLSRWMHLTREEHFEDIQAKLIYVD